MKFIFTFVLLIGTQLALADALTSVHLRGVVVPAQQAKLSVAQQGQVEWIAADGTEVKTGETLIQINATKLKAEMIQAQAMYQSALAELAAANHSLEKSRRLVQENILSDIALTEAEFSVKTAEAKVAVNQSKLELAKLAVAQAIVLAPFDGVVASSKISIGEWAQPGDPILEFASLSTLSMSLDVPPEYTETLSPGDSTTVLFAGKPIGTATVKRLFPLLQPSSGLRRVIWTIETDETMLISGRYVELKAWF
ncbi:efflux RND transporter periplasmic adaptor subunit [Planctobacterium marinum]